MLAHAVRSVVLVTVVLLSAGCLSGPPVAETPTPTTSTVTPTPQSCLAPDAATPSGTPDTDTPTAGAGTPTATVSGFEFSPERETPLRLVNEGVERLEMRVRVVCAPTNVTVHAETYTVDPRRKPRSVYDLGTADPEGYTTLQVVVTARNVTGTATVQTTDCADVTAKVLENGEVRVWTTC
jgi:hypothetical protein